MKKDPLYKLLKKSESIGLLCNQSAWHKETGLYSFQSIAATGKLKKVFIPEHGLFGELQDQVKLNDTSAYLELQENIEWISLYSNNHSLTATNEQLQSIDTLVIDIQDVGARYFTFTSTIWLLLNKITILNLDIKIIVLDKPNPAGRQIEGTRITAEYASFIGLKGLPHRHGLTIGELCRYFKNKLEGDWELFIVPVSLSDYLFISPSPNIPTQATCLLYSGQCLWEGTSVSEGRGTSQPFSIIGDPALSWVFEESWNDKKHPVYQKNCLVRPMKFIPVFHKHANTVCFGLQLQPIIEKKHHSLAHSLQLIKFIKEKTTSFHWREGLYEAFNNKKAIELLVGDQLLLHYFDDAVNWKEIVQKLADEENEWEKEVSPFLIYKTPLQKLKLK